MSETIDGLPFIDHGGVPRKLAWLHEEDAALMASLPPFGDSGYPVLQESDLTEVDHFTLGVPVKDQGRVGSCTNQTLTTAFRNRWRLMGRGDVDFSSTWNYLHVNGGADQGASLAGIITSGVRDGFCLESQCPQGHIFQQQVPDLAAAQKTAQEYRVAPDGFFRCGTYLELLSAVVLDFPVGFGLLVGNNFGDLDPEGLCPTPDVVRGGHALCGGRTKKSRRGYMALGFINSWTTGWGLGGYGYVGPQHFERRIDAWALVRPADTGTDEDQIPKAK